MSEVAEWLADIAAAADELGYGIVEIGVKHIKLSPLGASKHASDVTVEGYFASGHELRRVLRPIKDVPA